MEPASVIGASFRSPCLPVPSMRCPSCGGPDPATSGVSASPSRSEARLALLMATISSFAWLPEIKCEGVA
eukprot:223092-Lingulodinium_polyedra.AAC.1